VNYAWNAGCVIIGAAGNNNKSDPFYPAAYDNVIGVSATDQSDVKASWSNYGPHVAVAAPGVSIYSTYWNDGSTYAHMGGTSMAAPHVAGVAALLFAQDGTRTNATVRAIIEETADDLGDAGWDQYYGHGRVNAYRAVLVQPPLTPVHVVGGVSVPVNKFELLAPWSRLVALVGLAALMVALVRRHRS
jgi:subtilisin family serine protease